MWKRMLPFLCILAGLAIFLYPTINDRYESYKQEQILAAWEQNLQLLDAPSEPIESPPATTNTTTPTPVADSNASPDAQDEPPAAGTLAKPMNGEPVEGVLTIDKIELKLPILTDATPAHLKLSVASMKHTGKPGEIGNYAIAGHRNRTYGKNFNRLDEVEIGDTIQVSITDSKTYTYIVTSKQVVRPTQVDILESNGKDSEITLITCHPMKNPTHRLIVKGKLVPDDSKAAAL
ncbi:sortase A [Paenibacillus phyllosphaerae]|uniref:Sortase A n=1 Tax=Paenibacillus phyllosphaerae TaxID=274593 RepID=A0A7W5AUA1_9BACL|nr:class D sortase [Paenibacillus phyllosphaerae]MBB3108904.1 sortase A [Paenibacillus phyllosphaerae]